MRSPITNSRFFRSKSSSSDSESSSSDSESSSSDSERDNVDNEEENPHLIELKLNKIIKENPLGVFSHLITTLTPPVRFNNTKALDSDDDGVDHGQLSTDQQNLIRRFHLSVQLTIEESSEQHHIFAEQLAFCYLEYRDKVHLSAADNKIENLHRMLTKVMTLADQIQCRETFLKTIQARNFPHEAYTKKPLHKKKTNSQQVLKLKYTEGSSYFKPGARRVEEERHLIELIDYVKQQLPRNLQNRVNDFIIPLFPFTVDSRLYLDNGTRKFDVTDYQGIITVDTKKHKIINGGIQIDVKHLKQQKHNRHSKLFMAITVMLFGMTDLGSKDNYRKGWFIDCEERMTTFDDKSMAFDLSFLSNKDIKKPFTPIETTWIKSIVTAIEKAINKGYLNPLATSPRAISPTSITQLILTNSKFLLPTAENGLSAPHVNFREIAKSFSTLSKQQKPFSLFDLACTVSPTWGKRYTALQDLRIAINVIRSSSRKDPLQEIADRLDAHEVTSEAGSIRTSFLFNQILDACDQDSNRLHLLASYTNGDIIKTTDRILDILSQKEHLITAITLMSDRTRTRLQSTNKKNSSDPSASDRTCDLFYSCTQSCNNTRECGIPCPIL